MIQSYRAIVRKSIVEVKIFPNKKSGLARVIVTFCDPTIVIKGFVIREKNGQKFVNAPSFPNSAGGLSSNIWIPNEFWHLLVQKILQEYDRVVKENLNK